MKLLNLILIAFGGALGSVFRFAFAHFLPTFNGSFPKATFLVNILASLFVGLVTGLLLFKFSNAEWLKYFAVIGFCGGFSTFSTFALEGYNLNLSGNYYMALGYILSSIVFSILAVILGLWISKIIT